MYSPELALTPSGGLECAANSVQPTESVGAPVTRSRRPSTSDGESVTGNTLLPHVLNLAPEDDVTPAGTV